MTDIIIKESKIDRIGVFANRDFKTGEVVLAWRPINLKRSEVLAMPEKEKPYIFRENTVYYKMAKPEKYVNHSCEPNTRTDNMHDIAIKNINKGDEITSDYGDNSPLAFKCNCGSKNCRTIITAHL